MDEISKSFPMLNEHDNTDNKVELQPIGYDRNINKLTPSICLSNYSLMKFCNAKYLKNTLQNLQKKRNIKLIQLNQINYLHHPLTDNGLNTKTKKQDIATKITQLLYKGAKSE